MSQSLPELKMPTAWRELVPDWLEQPAAQELNDALARESTRYPVYPPLALRFRALEWVDPEAVRVVILGQDPYHGPGQAMGLAFSVPSEVRVPPSLRNIQRELGADLGITPPTRGDLSGWARQGVLLLNSVLSVRAGVAGSHAGLGWQALTQALLERLAARYPNRVFLLWGKQARKMGENIDPQQHKVLCAPHPSPLSAYRGFFGCGHFSQANAYLHATGQLPVDWAPDGADPAAGLAHPVSAE